MAEAPTFGRRRVPGSVPGPAGGPRRPPPRSPSEVSAAAEAFAASLREGRIARGEDAAFDDWLKTQKIRRLRFLAVRFGLLAPGLLCFFVDAPMALSFGLEIAGMIANVWVKTERKKQAEEIATWKAHLGAD